LFGLLGEGDKMKAFRGSLFAAIALVSVWLGLRFIEPGADPEAGGSIGKVDATSIFRFEKPDVVRIEVRRPGDTITLSDGENGWVVDPGGFPASRSMVSRVKHQLHDLDARAEVVGDPEGFALYGLGAQAIEVNVSLRNGEVIRFAAGDPNPTSVSYYIRPLPGEVVYTVKKSAVDFYSFGPDAFREPRFAIFDAKDATRLEADLPEGRRLVLQREGETDWEMLEPTPMAVEADRVRALLGRVGALKAQAFLAEVKADSDRSKQIAPYGLLSPQARIQISFGSRDSIDLSIGRNVSEKVDEDQAFMMLASSPSIYSARVGLLEDFVQDAQVFRKRGFVPFLADDLRTIEITLADREGSDPSGTVRLKMVSDAWKWEDGRPVPGSTPKRVAERLAGVRANDFVDDPNAFRKARFDEPLATVVLTDAEGQSVTLLLGQKGPPLIDELEEREIDRYFAKLATSEQIYLVDEGVVAVLEDAIREHNRKVGKDDEQQERREAIDEAMLEER
jgi:hypothetical protein